MSSTSRKKPRMGKPNQSFLQVNVRGFLATCNFFEKESVRECLFILNKYADDLYGKTGSDSKPEDSDNAKPENADIEDNNDAESEDTGDIADMLQANIATDGASNKQYRQSQRFFITKTGVKSCFFIRTTLPDPVELIRYILNRYDARTELLTRHTLRLIPIETICRSDINEIKAAAKPLIRKHFTEPTTFAIVFKRHHSANTDRDAVIKTLAEIVHEENAEHRVDLKNGVKTIIVEFIKSFCLIAVVEGYYRYRKYNLAELASGGCEAKKTDQQQDAKTSKTVADAERNYEVSETVQPQPEPKENSSKTVVLS